MNPIGRFLVNWFVYAVLYYAIGRVLWPGDHTALGAIPSAVSWGLIMQILWMRREARVAEGKEPYPPRFYYLAGVLGLGVCGACWVSIMPRPTTMEWLGLLAGGALSIYLLRCGLTLSRRIDSQGVGAGA